MFPYLEISCPRVCREPKSVFVLMKILLTLSWRRSPSYRNQSIDLLCKSIDWFLCDRDLLHERVKETDHGNSSLISSFLLKFSRETVFEANSGLKKSLYHDQRQI